MKKLFFTLAFIAAALTSCMTEQTVRYDGINSVKVSIDVEAPQLNGTRGSEVGMNSGLGAIDNFSDAEWAKYDLRYIFEVYDVTEGYANYETPIKTREVKTYDKYESTSFDMRLIPNRKYKFVVWADFVEQGETADLNYNTTKLNNITRKGDVSPMNEAMDAYFIQKSIYVEGKLNETLELTRPFGKIRVIATDVDEVNLNSDPSIVEIKFYHHPTFLSLNALTGQAEAMTETVTYSYNIPKGQPYSAGYDAKGTGSQTLFADYIFAQTADDGAQEVNFTMTVKSADGRTIREHDFNTQIPLERNYLTTIIGNLLTTETEFSITIDDNFDGEYITDTDKDDSTVVPEEYIYLKPNSNWTQANARFAVYTWVDGGEDKWVDMVDSDSDGIYEVVKSELNSNIIFCRMNPSATANNWNNKWNQTSDLTLPTNGDNLYTIAAGSWDNGTWSAKE